MGSDTLFGGLGADRLQGSESNEFNSLQYDYLYCGFDLSRDDVLLTNSRGNLYQGNGYAVVFDFNRRQDYIYLKGDSSQYRVAIGNYGLGSSATSDVRISTTSGDVMAFISDLTWFNLSSTIFGPSDVIYL